MAALCWAGWGAMVWAVLHDRTGSFDTAGLTWLRNGPGLRECIAEIETTELGSVGYSAVLMNRESAGA